MIYIKKITALVVLVLAMFSPLESFAQNEPVAILSSSNITPNSVRLTGHVTNPDNTTITISWGKQGQAISGTSPSPGIGLTGADNSFIYDISNLEAGTTYYVAISDAVAHTTISTSPSSFTFTTGAVSTGTGNPSEGGVAVILQKYLASDTAITLNFFVVTSGVETGLKLKYGKSESNLNETSEEFYRGSSTGDSPAAANVTIASLDPETYYYFSVVNSSTGVEYSVNPNSVPTTAAGADPVTITAGTSATQTTPCPDGQYCLLAPLPGIASSIDFKGTSIGQYLNMIFKFLIGLAGVLAVVMLVLGGIQYMSTDAISGKEAGKERMTSSILGLLLALGAFVILNTISPTLTKLGLNIDTQNIEVTGDSEAPVGDISTFGGQSASINCPGTGGYAALSGIAAGFTGKVTYLLGGKGATGPSNTVYLDCSGFVNRALQCAGVTFTNAGTFGIFNGAEQVTSLTATSINGTPLKVGDLIGWTASARERAGHVVMYIGNGQTIESHGPAGKVGQAISVFSADHYKDRIKFIKRAQ